MTTPYSIALIEKRANRLAFYDYASGMAEGAIDLPPLPHEMARDPDGRTAYIGHYGALNSADPAPGGSTVVVVDLITRKILSEINLAPYRRLHGLQCDAQGRLFVLAEADDTLLVIEHPKTERRITRALRTGGVKGHLVAVTASGEQAFCANLTSHTVTRVSPFGADSTPLAIRPGPKPEGMCLSPDERRLMVLNRGDGTLAEVDAASAAVLRVSPLRGEATRIYRHGADAYFITCYHDESVLLVDSTTLEELFHLRLGGRTTAASLHPARPEALVSLESDHIVRIDLRTFSEIARYPTGRDPDVSSIVPRLI